MWLWITMLASELPSAPVDFDTQLMSILTKADSNAGPCHGAGPTDTPLSHPRSLRPELPTS